MHLPIFVHCHIDLITMKNTYQDIIDANRRHEAMRRRADYDPVTGRGCCGERVTVNVPDHGILHLPKLMVNSPAFDSAMEWTRLCKLRLKYDFEYWCVTCATVKDKSGGGIIPFTLNPPQRRVLAMLESMRIARHPIRAIILKARQWGCSTLIACYMAWIQIELTRYWNSITCAHNLETTTILKCMLDNVILSYPQDLWSDDEALRLKSMAGSRNLFKLCGTGSNYLLCSAASPNVSRGHDISMAHFSEVAFYRSRGPFRAEESIASICSSITLDPNTLVVMESTANGVGNYFHTEWLNAKEGKSDKVPIFVPWYELDIYRREVTDVEALVDGMDDYAFNLFYTKQLTLEQMQWYQLKRKEYQNHSRMMAEYPSDDVEAFSNSDRAVFDSDSIEALRPACGPPLRVGELQGKASKGPFSLHDLHFVDDVGGRFKVWEPPDEACDDSRRYVVAVDIGGRSISSDFSVIAVFDRRDPDHPELVAQWRGHIDHDLLAWKAAMIAKWYAMATLIIESNTLETDRTEGDHGEFILHELQRHYRRLYIRDDGSPGFHTNTATKTRIINSLIAIYRDQGYIEHDSEALNEALCYEQHSNGTFGAKEGLHDDILITRALALSYCHDRRLIELGREARAHDLSALKI